MITRLYVPIAANTNMEGTRLVLSLLVSSLCLLQASGNRLAPKADCSLLFIPATNDSSSCESYDLTKLASLGGVNFTIQGGYSYTLSVCGNVESGKVPSVCSGKAPSPGYQWTATACHIIGSLDAVNVFPVDPTNSSAGIRIGYNNGETGTADWPRAVIYDFHCDPSAGVGQPQSVVEFPSYTYKVRWPSAYACPGTRAKLSCPTPKFDGTWNTLRFRPRPSWYDDVKFGIFIHWGIFSVPAFKNEWYWKRLMDGDAEYVEFHNRVYGCSGVRPDKFPCTGPNFTYPEFAPMFKPIFYDPDAWAALFKKAGAKYVVLTSKHHEGWCNFKDIYHWNWNSMDVGPKRDLVGDLTASVKAAGLHMGLYHSLREWFNPLYVQDNDDNCSTTSFVDEVLHPTLKEIVTQYEPEVVWADGAGDAPCTHSSIHYWKSPEFLSWLYNDSPVKETVIANSRWGDPAFGDFQTGGDRFTPGTLIGYKWESCFTIQHSSWGYDRTEGIEDFWNATRLLWQLVSSVSCNGNLLLNVGPTSDGRILPPFEERLLQMGAWLEINGEAIYNSVPWVYQNDTRAQLTWYTASKDGSTVYAITFDRGALIPDSFFKLNHVIATQQTTVDLLGYGHVYSSLSGTLEIQVPDIPYGQLPYAWTFKMVNIQAN